MCSSDLPTNRAHRVTVQTRLRDVLGELLVGLELLFELTQDPLFVFGERHADILARTGFARHVAREVQDSCAVELGPHGDDPGRRPPRRALAGPIDA